MPLIAGVTPESNRRVSLMIADRLLAELVAREKRDFSAWRAAVRAAEVRLR
jgi:hypothetical protein